MSLKNRDRVSKGYIVDEMHRYNILLESREIFLHGYIDSNEEDPGVEYRMSNNFLKNIKLLEHMDSSKPITVHQHSIGGEWSEGMMMYDLRITMPNCWWLIHDGTTAVSGHTIRQAKSWHEWEGKLESQMMEIYSTVCMESDFFEDKSIIQVKNYIKKQLDKKEDWWMSGEEAVERGFADAIFGSEDYEDLEKIKSHVY